ncbi:MAG: HD domain-containing protein [Thermoguttaceae bacterium]|jgi:3'-5' exoribonuclease|nr:HD domain-containing protein [Thermoguttaceae bacterium]
MKNHLVALSEMQPDQEADFFALFSTKEELTTKNGKPYFRVTFRDGHKEVSFPVWGDSPWAADCRDGWTPGRFYKLRATYRETQYGPQLEIRRIREATDADKAEGFDPAAILPCSRFSPEAMFDELLALAREWIEPAPLCRLVEELLVGNRDALLQAPAARQNHHAYAAGLLEHTLSVTRTCMFLAGKYAEYYCDMQPPLDKGLVVAGGILHDIGKLRELDAQPHDTAYTAEGTLIGHMLQGRDMVRESPAFANLDAETRLRLEHLIIAHQRLPEWGSPKPPMTPEALLVHYADDIDAKFHMMAAILRNDTTPGPLTSRRNVLGQHVFRGS